MLTDLWPTTGMQFTSDEHAAILAGLVAKNAAGIPRAGVLPRHTNTLVTARPDMRVNILPMELVHVKEGARFAALTETIDLAIPNPPSANTQYNIVAYVGTDKKLTGVASTSEFVVIPGTPSATPADPALPDAAIPIARVAVPSTATATNSAGVVITPIQRFTAASGGVIIFHNLQDMKAWVPGRSQRGRLINYRGQWEYDGTRWVPMFVMAGVYVYRQNIDSGGFEKNIVQTPAMDAPNSSEFMSEIFDLTTAGWVAKFDMEILVDGSARNTIGSGLQSLNYRTFWRSRRSGVTYHTHPIYHPFEVEGIPVHVRMYLRAGEVLGFSAFQTSGNTVTMVLDPRVTYLGPI